MTITWPWINDKSTNDQRFVQLAYDVARLTNALDAATQHDAAMEQRVAQLEAIAKTQAEQLRALNIALMNIGTALRQYEGDGR
jgi:hypothetical protein